MASELIDHNPMMKKPILAVLDICIAHPGKSRAVIEDLAGEVWAPQFRQMPASIIDTLVREDYLTELITVDGQPYDGTLADVYSDDSIPLEAEVDALLTATSLAEAAIADYAPAATLSRLFDERPAYASQFEKVLTLCAAPAGASRAELESAIGTVESPEGKTVYPQYFLDALETAGGIEWTDSWHTTSAGNSLLAG